MQADDIKKRVSESINTTHIDVQLEGNHAHLVVVSEEFEGLNPVKKQQRVYACLSDVIASGAIHAVHMQTYTPTQWADKA